MNLFGQRRNKRHEVVLGDAALREPGSEMMVARDGAREHGTCSLVSTWSLGRGSGLQVHSR